MLTPNYTTPASPKSGDLKIAELSSGNIAVLPASDRFSHVLTLGPAELGRMDILKSLAHQDLQNRTWGFTLIDPEGTLAKEVWVDARNCNRPAILFDPSEKISCKFNPLAGKEDDVVENIATTFRMLNPNSSVFFLDLNEQLIKNAVRVLKRLDASEGVEGKYATLISLNRLLQNVEGQGRAWVNQFARITTDSYLEAVENREIASWFLNEYLPERSKIYENTSGVRSQVSKLVSNDYLRVVLNPDFNKGERNELDFGKHLSDTGVICISGAAPYLRELSSWVCTLVFMSFYSGIVSRKAQHAEKIPHTIYLDEFQKYTNSEFIGLLSRGKTYNFSAVLAAQSGTFLSHVKGKPYTDTLIDTIPNVILHPVLSNKDSEFFADLFSESLCGGTSGNYGQSPHAELVFIDDEIHQSTDVVCRLQNNGRLMSVEKGKIIKP